MYYDYIICMQQYVLDWRVWNNNNGTRINYTMDRSEDDAVYEDDDQSNSDIDRDEDVDSIHDCYDDNEYTEEDFRQLFGAFDSEDNDDFDRFENSVGVINGGGKALAAMP